MNPEFKRKALSAAVAAALASTPALAQDAGGTADNPGDDEVIEENCRYRLQG